MLIGVVPFSTAFLGRYPLEQPAIILYGINFLLLAVMFRITTSYVIGHHDSSDKLLYTTSRNNWFGIFTFIFGIAFSFLSSYISLAFFALMPIFYLYQAFFGMYRQLK
jgi:uncharacterized membrane protein